MTAIYLLFSTLGALAFYLASAHQRWWPSAQARTRALRLAGWAATALGAAAAIAALGPWAGTFAALTTLMLASVLLPYLDAWWHLPAERRHVG